MYEELEKALRETARWSWSSGDEEYVEDLLKQAADAIEELSAAVEGYESSTNMALVEKDGETVIEFKPKWIKIESRPMDDEERKYYSEHYGYDLDDHEAVIYCCQLPEHGQEVLVCNEYGHIWLDTFDDDPDYGVGFETNGDMDGLVAWMPLPEPPKE